MKAFFSVVAMCCVAVQAVPSGYGGHGGEQFQLVGIPDQSSYEKLTYPNFELQDLGTSSHGHIPAEEIKVFRTIKISVPEPYPVRVPHKVPFPVHVVKPYPVHVTKLVQVPHPVPVEVVKNVPVHVEVPKPYPVPAHEYSDRQGLGSQGEGQWQPSSGDNSYQGGGYEGGEGHADQSAGYAAVVAAQNFGGEEQQQQEQQQEQYGGQGEEQGHK